MDASSTPDRSLGSQWAGSESWDFVERWDRFAGVEGQDSRLTDKIGVVLVNKQVVGYKPMELEARRALAMLGFVRAEKSPSEGKRALKEAQLAMDLEPRPDWFSHFVLAAALYAADQGAKARELLSEAEKSATAENLELCGRLRKHIEDGEAFEWDFILANSLSPVAIPAPKAVP